MEVDTLMGVSRENWVKRMLTLKAVIMAIMENVNDPKTLDKARKSPRFFTRKRKMDFPQLVYLLMNTINTSTQTALNRFFKNILEESTHMSQQALSKARSHFDHSPFEGMFRKIVSMRYSFGKKVRKWQGYQVMAVDGSAINLPNLPELLQIFGGSGRNADSPTAQASILLDVPNDFVIDACLERYGTSERKMALGHMDALKEYCPRGKKLLIFDRGYASLELILSLLERHFSFVMRVRAKWNTNVDNAVSGALVTLSDGTVIRIIKLTLPSGETETLITNLRRVKESEFMTLYFMRWPVETKYDIVKNKLALENFSGVSENAILQDFWVCALLANIVSVAKDEAGILVDEAREGKNNLHQHVPNTSDLVASLKDEFVSACLDSSSQKRNKRIASVIDEISRSVIPIRPGRSVPRTPPRKSMFHFNAKSST
jgi:hypothetical protein